MTKLTRFSGLVVTLALVVSSAVIARAATSIVNIRYSPDITVTFSGTTLNDENVALDNLAGVVTPMAITGIPSNAGIGGFHFTNSTTELLSLDTTVALPGLAAPGIATPADVVSYSTGSATYSYVFRGATSGIPDGVAIDGLSKDHLGNVLLSFDTSVDVQPGAGVVVADDEDIVRWNGGTSFTVVFDGSAAGVSESLDVDGVAYLTATHHFLVSFDTSGSVGGVSFDDEDVLEYAPESGTWSLSYDGTAMGTGHPEWAAADLVAFDTLVDSDHDGVEDGSDNCPTVANPNQADTEVGGGDGVGDACDNCPTVRNGVAQTAVANVGNQIDGTTAWTAGQVLEASLPGGPDGVGDACDNCPREVNPRVASDFLTTNPWVTLTGGQRDDDHDGYGNRCDADFTATGVTVGPDDLTQYRSASGKARSSLTACGSPTGQRCARFDLNESGVTIGPDDLTVYRSLSGKTPGPRCPTCPLACQAGTSGTCAPLP